MRIPQRSTVLTLLLLLAWTAGARANLATDYVFMEGTGTGADMSGSTTLVSAGNDDVWSSAQPIGFDFYLDGQPFSYFIASTNGATKLGTSSSLSHADIYAYYSFNSASCPMPIVTALFDDMVASGNGVRTKLIGSAPNRIRVIEWEGYLWYGDGTNSDYHYQVRLYEGSNKIEFWYDYMGSEDETNGNGQIGAALNTSNFISIAAGSPATATGSVVINDLSSTPISYNTLYTLRPCQKNFTIAGNPAQGGTLTMDSGASLLSGFRSRVGSSLPLQPFTISMGEFPCGTSTYQYTITGNGAADYTITPSEGQIGSFQNLSPTLTFSPRDTGLRQATLRITDGKGFNRAYTLQGVGFRCVDWVGNTAEGGTAKLLNKDTLLDGRQVPIGSSRGFTPIRINQLSTDIGCSSPVSVTYTLNDPTGNYSITPANETVPVAGSSIPTITFNARNGVGYQEATLTVNADGEVRTFLLRAFIAAPGGVIRYAGTPIGPQFTLFRDQVTCVGESVLTLELEAANIGTGDFVVRNLRGYLLDSTLRQGTPPYPILRDAFGQPVPAQDYFLSTTPGVAPRVPGGEFDSLVVPEGQTQKLYLNIVPTRSGKRYGRLYISTNAFNLRQPNIFGDSTQGLVFVDVFARGMGSMLAGGADMGRPKPVVFPATKVRESRTITSALYNDGDCDLRIDAKRLRFESGEVNEFELLNLSGGTFTGEEYILAPGQSLNATVKFTPGRSGSRSATMRLVTNDSSLVIPQITERGIFYWEFFGTGKHDLEARNLSMPPAVIGGESSTGTTLVENTKLDPILIDSIVIVGGAGQIQKDPSKPWPSMPLKMGPGEKLNLGFVLIPTPNSAPGMRQAELLIFLSNGDTARAVITGYAGTRELTVAPSELFTNKEVPVGEQARAFFTITNNGTMPATLNRIVINGPNKTYYTVAPLQRKVMEPGQTEFIEVTYLPAAQGAHTATAEVESNATNGTQVVQLGGQGTSTAPINNPPTGTAPNFGSTEFGRNEAPSTGNGTALSLTARVSPNPTQGRIDVAYSLPEAGDVTCELYSADGRLIRTLYRGTEKTGEHAFQADLRDLPQALYFVMVRSGGGTAVTRVSLSR